MISVEIVTDGGAAGMGHLTRSSALARHLRANGDRAWLRPASPDAAALVSPALTSEPGEPDVVVVDVPESGDRWIVEAHRAGRPTLGLDFVGHAAPTLVLSVFDRGTAVGGGAHRHGLRYALIRDDIRSVTPTRGDHVVVMLGGRDVLGQSGAAAERAAAGGRHVIVVDGPLAPPPSPPPSGVERRRCPPDLAELMGGCAWAVANGGSSMLELLHLGKPVFALPQTADEERLVAAVDASGALAGVGLASVTEPGPREAAAAARARELVDGCGIDRVTEALHELARA